MDDRLRKNRREKRVWKWIVRVVLLAAVAVGVLMLFSDVRSWMAGLFSGLSFDRASEILSQKIEEKGDYVADEYTEEGILRGSISVFVSVEADYTYKAQIGVTLRDIVITPRENDLLVAVPDMRVLSDSFQINGEPRYSDPLNLRQLGVEFQQLVDEHHASCAQAVEENRENMERCWNDTCNQLRDWFGQWTGKDLPVTFVRLSEAPALDAAP